MKYVKLMVLFLIVSFVLAGCGEKTPKGPEDVQRLLMKLKSYRCDVVYAVTNNKSTNVYKAKHLYKSPDKYRIEIVEPSELKGQTTIFNGDKAYIYHPQINAYMETQNFMNSVEHSSFVGSFIEYFKDNGGSKLKMESINNVTCYVLEVPIAGDNPYRAKERIWISGDTSLPIKAEILDKNDQLSAQVLYENFEINPILDDSLFEIQGKK